MRTNMLIIYIMLLFYSAILLLIVENSKADEVKKSTNLEKKDSEFFKLYDEWKKCVSNPNVMPYSTIEPYLKCDAFEKIVSLGNDVVPLIINELNKGHFFLFVYALEKITGEKPYKKQNKPYLSEQDKVKAWLEWWEKNKNKYCDDMGHPI